MTPDYSYLATLFPPAKKVLCPKCEHQPYVFGIPVEGPEKEVLACSSCGFLFNYPCQQCHQDSALPLLRDLDGFFYKCQECGFSYHKPFGWLQKPLEYQKKLQKYFAQQKSEKDRALEALE